MQSRYRGSNVFIHLSVQIFFLKVSFVKTLFIIVVYFFSDINEKKQFVLYETWKFERKDIQLALKNAVYDLEILKRMNRELEEDVHEQKYAQNWQSYFFKE